jgi:hypothetical protein
MIPASYLFKDAFHQSFYEPDIEAAVERHRRTHRGLGIFAWLRLRLAKADTASDKAALGRAQQAFQG